MKLRIKNTGIVAWLLALVWLALYEWWALATNHQSLSRAMWLMTTAWPPLIFLIGLLVGGLAVHFWWIWSPATSTKGGG